VCVSRKSKAKVREDRVVGVTRRIAENESVMKVAFEGEKEFCAEEGATVRSRELLLKKKASQHWIL